MSKMPMYCVAEISTKVSTRTSCHQSILSHNTTWYIRSVKPVLVKLFVYFCEGRGGRGQMQ